MRMTTILLIIIAIFGAVVLSGCRSAGFKEISQEEAMKMMEEQSGYLIVDVRRADEYAAGHIPGAINVPNEAIQEAEKEDLENLSDAETGESESPLAVIPDKDQMLLIYCRTGNRSKQAARKLATLGYTNIYEFGGINTWEGEIVTE